MDISFLDDLLLALLMRDAPDYFEDLMYQVKREPGILNVDDEPIPHGIQVGLGVQVSGTQLDFTQGSVDRTDRPLDMMIDGEGFFVVREGNGELRLTRDGRFAISADGDLVMANNGMAILDTRNQPIRLDRDLPVEIDSQGNVEQAGEILATIRVARPTDPLDLVKIGGNLLRSDSIPPPSNRQTDRRVLPGHLENSAVNSITLLKDLVGAAKSFGGNIKMMQYHDHIMGQAINTFGRVA